MTEELTEDQKNIQKMGGIIASLSYALENSRSVTAGLQAEIAARDAVIKSLNAVNESNKAVIFDLNASASVHIEAADKLIKQLVECQELAAHFESRYLEIKTHRTSDLVRIKELEAAE